MYAGYKGRLRSPFYIVQSCGLDDVQGGIRVDLAAIFGGQSPATFLSVDP